MDRVTITMRGAINLIYSYFYFEFPCQILAIASFKIFARSLFSLIFCSTSLASELLFSSAFLIIACSFSLRLAFSNGVITCSLNWSYRVSNIFIVSTFSRIFSFNTTSQNDVHLLPGFVIFVRQHNFFKFVLL